MYITLENNAKGKFETELPVLVITPERIECNMHPGENFQGSFTLRGDKELRGYLTVSSPRMTCSVASFNGKENTIYYKFDGRGMGIGEVVKGKIDIISNAGEYSLPFVATIDKCHISSSLGSIRNLFHFANLAQNSWNEAVRLFQSNNFVEIFSPHDMQYLPLYEGLLGNVDKNYALEEFLIAIRKKDEVVFWLDQDEIDFCEIEDDIRESIPLNKKHWGYFEVEVQSDAEFLELSKKYLHQEEFVGNFCPYSYYVRYDKMHAGKNVGRITFRAGKFTMHYQVTAYKGKQEKCIRKDKGLVFNLIQYYLDFRMKVINSSAWIFKSTEAITQSNIRWRKDTAILLYQVQLLLAEKRVEEAVFILRNNVDARQLRRNEPVNYCYYLYLNALAEPKVSVRDKALAAVNQMMDAKENHWILMWIKLYLDEEYEENYQKKYQDIKQFCSKGCDNPILYLEALNILKKDDCVLTSLDDFDLKLLNWAGKKAQVNEELALRVVYLAQKEQKFSNILFQVLQECYDIYPTVEGLQVICTLLIRSDKRESKYFTWYAKGVENDLKITRLYEHYLMTADTSTLKKIPKNVMMYFMYQCDLGYKKQAFLYAALLKNKEEYGDLYEKHKEQIYRFAREQLSLKHMNEDLALIYKEELKEDFMDERQADALSAVMFTYKVKVEEENVLRVCVRHSALFLEEVFPCVDGIAYVNIYNDTYCLLGEDAFGRKFPLKPKKEPVRLLGDAKLEEQCFKYAKHEIGVYIHKLIDKGECLEVTEKNIKQLRSLSHSLIVKPEEKQNFYVKIADYYYESKSTEELDNYLLELEVEELKTKDRARIIEYMIMEKMYEKSYYYVCIYGTEGIHLKLLLRMCSLYLNEKQESLREDDMFRRLCHYLYDKGKYDLELLTFLVRYYQGSLSQMRTLWKSAREFGIDNYELEERMLVQALFAHSYVEELSDIFLDYVRQGARPSIEKAFISNFCFEYFSKECVAEPEIFEHLYQMVRSGEELPDICEIALLKFWGQDGDTLEEREKVLAPLLKKYLTKNCYYEFMKNYNYDMPELLSLKNRTIFEFHSQGNSIVEIHYTYEHLDGEYQVIPMKEWFEGVYTADFILFFAEALQYYITERQDQEESLVSSGRMMMADQIDKISDNRYHMLNDCIISRTMQDEKTMEILLEKYETMEYMTKQLFVMK